MPESIEALLGDSYSPKPLDEVRNDLALLCQVLGLAVRTGGHLCPFHAETSPSFFIKQYPSGIYWRCFASCGGGNIIDALVRKTGVSESEAIIRLTGKSTGRIHPKRYRRKTGAISSAKEPEQPTPKSLRLDVALKKIKAEIGQHRNYFDLRGIPEWVAEMHSVAFFDDVRFMRTLPALVPFETPDEHDKPLSPNQENLIEFVCRQILVPGQRLCGVENKKPYPMTGCFDPEMPYWRNLIRAHVAGLPATISVRYRNQTQPVEARLPILNLGAYYGGVSEVGNNIVANFCLDCDISDHEHHKAEAFMPDEARRREYLNRVKSPEEQATEKARLTELMGKIPTTIPCVFFQKKASGRWHAHGLLTDKRDANTVKLHLKSLLPPELQHIEINPKAALPGPLMEYRVGNYVRLPFAYGYEAVEELKPVQPLDVSMLPADVSAKYQYNVFKSFVMPITDAGGTVRAIKIHRQDPGPDEKKGSWLPVGTKGHSYMTLWPEPELAEPVPDQDGKPSNRAETVDHWIDMNAESGAEWEVKAVEFKDDRLNLAWDIIVTSELIQALGRARPYEPRTGTRQTVLIFTSQPLGVPVTRSMLMRDHASELGTPTALATQAMPTKPSLPARIRAAMETLIKSGEFGYKELAATLGCSETTLKQKQQYNEAVAAAVTALGLELVQRRRKPGVFRTKS